MIYIAIVLGRNRLVPDHKFKLITISSTNNHSEDSQQHNIITTQHLVEGTTDISTALSSVLVEEKERSKRQLNLTLYNLKEASEDDAEAWEHH